MKLLDTDHPFFRPLWIRVAVVAVAAGWGGFELWTGSPWWGALFLAFAALSAWASSSISIPNVTAGVDRTPAPTMLFCWR